MTAGDSMWRAAAAELSPDRSLARVDAKAQQVVGTVSVVGLALTSLGLVASELLDLPSAARLPALAAAAAAIGAVVLAIGSSLLRVAPALAPGNLVEVEAWYRRQFRRGYLVVAAGWLLLVAVVLAALAAVATIASDQPGEPTLAVQTAGRGAAATLTARAEFPRLAPDEVLRAEVVGVRPAAPAETILARAVARAGAGGTATATLEVAELAGYRKVRLTAESSERRCTATLRLGPVPPPARAGNTTCRVVRGRN